jgi:glyoxylase-like metal-dependent hydrolase (beta-lactamase superfamily II)
MTITRVVDFSFEYEDPSATLAVEVCGFGVRTDGRRILIDPWLAFDAKQGEADAAARWKRISKELAAADLASADIDTVVFTHLDGVGWAVGLDGVPSFPHARHLVPAGELEAFDQGRRGGTEALEVLRAHGLVDPVEAPLEIAPGVTLEAAVGHTKSSTVVRVREGTVGEGTVGEGNVESLFVGHLFLNPVQIQRLETVLGDEDPAALVETRRRLLDEAVASGAVLYGDLWAGMGCGTVVKYGDSYALV